MTSPFVEKRSINIVSKIAGTDGDDVICEAPFDGVLSEATFTPEAAITGDTTTARTLTIMNKGQAGAGTVVMATLVFITGVDGVAFDEKAFGLSAVAGARNFAQGDIISIVETHASTGIANPGGQITVGLTRNYA